MVFWNNWIEKHPDKIETVFNAKAIVLGIQFEKTLISESKIERELSHVLAQLEPEKKDSKSKKPTVVGSIWFG